MEVPPGKSSLVLLVPCHVILHPPDCLPMLSAPSPATNMRLPADSGRVLFLFLSSTSDSRTAWAAISRCSALPIKERSPDKGRFAGLGLSKRPARTFTRRIRRTASSMRDIAIVPSFTCARVLSYSTFQSFGTMKISKPALIAWAQSSLLHPFTCPWPFQSPTTKPSKPIWSFSTSVSRYLWP